MKKTLALVLLLALPLSAEKSAELFVALCDNKTQGIAKVGAKIGNGDNAPNNLYWGCSDGARSYFKNSTKWTLQSSEKNTSHHIIETSFFKHKSSGIILTAHAYRGSEMNKCLEDYFEALKTGGPEKLVAFIGHNGLMDANPNLPEKSKDDAPNTPTVILCCLSERFFEPHLSNYHAKPLLLTKQLMYPGAFILHDVIEVWLANGSPESYLNSAARAYSKNQGISVKAAKGVFTTPQ